jgi:hypothetical protein
MGIFGDILDIGGGLLEIFGSISEGEDAEDYYEGMADYERATAKANADISLYDAEVAEKEAFYLELAAGYELQNQMKQVDKVMGTAMAKLGKSGVALGKGSALDIEVEIAAEGARDSAIIANEGKLAASRARSMAGRFRKLAAAGLRDSAYYAHALEKAGESAKAGAYWRAGGVAITEFSEFAQEQGWF